MKKRKISDAVIRRLPRYYRYLDDLHSKGIVRISSSLLGERMGITASQIRQDLSCFGEFGQQGYGYYIHLDKKEDVSKIVIKIQSSGGKGYIRVNTNGDPNAGEQVAEFTFAEGGTTEVKLDKSVNTQDIVMWVPIDSLPGNQLYINSMQAF